MSELGVVLQVHGEVTDPAVDVFDREARFIDDGARAASVERFPKLQRRFRAHHDARGGRVRAPRARTGVAATITPQHLLMNRNALFTGGIRPHHYCLPVLKTEPDRRALLEAIASGDPRFFLGTDSAPHARHTKETACGCAGMFSAHAAIELYAEAFEAIGALRTPGRLCVRVRRGFLWLAAQRRKDHPRQGLLGGPRVLSVRQGSDRAAAGRRTGRWRLAT